MRPRSVVAAADAQARAAADFDTRQGTPGEAIAKECLDLRLQLEKLRELPRAPVGGEMHGDADLAALPALVAQTEARQRELCGD